MASNMPRQDIMYEIMERLGSHSVRGAHRDDCIMWTGARAGLSGYGCIRNPLCTYFPSQSTFVRVHRLAYAVFNDLYTFEIPSLDAFGDRLDVSHICHHKLCINPEHLVLEKHVDNGSRQTCLALGACSRNHPIGVDCIIKN